MSDTRKGSSPVAPGEDEVEVALAGRYRIVRKLGRGRGGPVYLAEDLDQDGQHVAIRVAPLLLSKDQRALADLQLKALQARRIQHPNLVGSRGFTVAPQGVIQVMDYVDGSTLDEALAHYGPLSEAQVQATLMPVAAALDHAHAEGAFHLDLKPSNIFLRRDQTPLLADLCISATLKEHLDRLEGEVRGGAGPYASPGRLRGESPSASEDVYGMAAVMYECLKGTPPPTRDIPGRADATPPLESPTLFTHSILRGLAEDPAARPSTCTELVRPPPVPVREAHGFRAAPAVRTVPAQAARPVPAVDTPRGVPARARKAASVRSQRGVPARARGTQRPPRRPAPAPAREPAQPSRARIRGEGITLQIVGGLLIVAGVGWLLLTTLNHWGFLATFGAFGTLSIGGMVRQRGKLMAMPTMQERLRKDHRPPVLLLRSFRRDALRIQVPRRTAYDVFHPDYHKDRAGYTYEQELERIFGRVGPVVALGSAEFPYTHLGAARDFTRDEEWQTRFLDLVEHAGLILVIVDDTASLLWELQVVLDEVNRSRVVLLLPEFEEDVPRSKRRSDAWRESWSTIRNEFPFLPAISTRTAAIVYSSAEKPILVNAKKHSMASHCQALENAAGTWSKA